MSNSVEKATFGAGCFWCTEAVFQRIEGVIDVKPGYAGGHVKNPSYREVCSGQTGHAEVIQLRYDPSVVDYNELLEVFFKTHDPTQLNRQGNDVGTQYRSVIFYHNQKQREKAVEVKQELNQTGIWKEDIVTEISSIDTFYPAEKEHINYYNQNSGQPYCQFIINPKLEKLESLFKQKLK